MKPCIGLNDSGVTMNLQFGWVSRANRLNVMLCVTPGEQHITRRRCVIAAPQG
jgi:hypothetical protein